MKILVAPFIIIKDISVGISPQYMTQIVEVMLKLGDSIEIQVK